MSNKYLLIRRISTTPGCFGGRSKWAVDRAERGYTHMEKALHHFDDFYSTVYAKNWPQIRLGLLSPAKYMAIGNIFTGEMDKISESLNKLGAFSVYELWKDGQEKIQSKYVENLSKRDEKRQIKMDEAVLSFAKTKRAEELDVFYQNLPDKKIAIPYTTQDAEAEATNANQEIIQNRIFSDVTDAENQYVTATKLKGLEDFQLESEYYGIGSPGDSVSDIQKEDLSLYSFTTQANCTKIEFPPFLKAYSFEEGNYSSFPSSCRSESTGLRHYICMNGSSIVPVIALDLKMGVNMLDLCAGPGTKSLLSFMSMCPASLTCNDLYESRLSRVSKLFQEFTGSRKPENVTYTHMNAASYSSSGGFQRVLADVPCSMDRISITEPENNLFKPTRIKERLSLIQSQKNILLSAFRSVSMESGSCVVYSTCSLSPVENDGVVMSALKETDVNGVLTVDLLGLWNVLKPLKEAKLFHLMKTKFGVIILPNILSNFGPMYVSRIIVN